MNPEQILLALLTAFPYMNGSNRECIETRRPVIARQLHETSTLGVPPDLMASVAFAETHLGCDVGEGGNWGAPIDARHRHTAGTHMSAARVLARGYERCGSWDGAVLYFRTGLCRSDVPTGRLYLRGVTAVRNRILRNVR